MQIDIVDYDPSITQELFTEVMEFTKSPVNIDDLTMDIIPENLSFRTKTLPGLQHLVTSILQWVHLAGLK